MRILITSDVFPPDAGGPATYVPIIAHELVERGHLVRVLTYSLVDSYAGDQEYSFSIERITVRGPRLLRLLRTFVRLAKNMRWAHLLYVNGLLIETGFVSLFVSKPAAAKVVGDIAWERARDKGWITDEFEEFQQRRYGWRIELRRTLRTWALRRMRAVVGGGPQRLPATGDGVLEHNEELPADPGRNAQRTRRPVKVPIAGAIQFDVLNCDAPVATLDGIEHDRAIFWLSLEVVIQMDRGVLVQQVSVEVSVVKQLRGMVARLPQVRLG